MNFQHPIKEVLAHMVPNMTHGSMPNQSSQQTPRHPRPIQFAHILPLLILSNNISNRVHGGRREGLGLKRSHVEHIRVGIPIVKRDAGGDFFRAPSSRDSQIDGEDLVQDCYDGDEEDGGVDDGVGGEGACLNGIFWSGGGDG